MAPARLGRVARFRRTLVSLAAAFALGSTPPVTAGTGETLAVPTDPEAVDVFLLTYDVGEEVYTKWGHVTLRIRDRHTAADVVFDWGFFDVSGWLGLASGFLTGSPTYELRVLPYDEMLQGYRAKRRSIWQHELRLTSAEKTRLLRRLSWNAQPENQRYSYDALHDNCATRIRDHLDEALDGRIARSLKPLPAGRTFRDHVRSALESRSAVAVGLDVLLNDEADRELSTWEELFRPEMFREHLSIVPASRVAGDVAAPGLLGEPVALLAFGTYPPPRLSAYLAAVVTLGPLLVAAAALALFRDAASDRGRRWRVRVIGAAMSVAGLLSAVLGTLMSVAWGVSTDTALHHNANLWLFWPVDWIVAVAGFRTLVTGRPWSITSRASRCLSWVGRAHLLAAATFVLLWLRGHIDQDVSRVALYLLPLVCLTYATVLLARVRRTPEPRRARAARSAVDVLSARRSVGRSAH